jgi:hypothetical protein
LKKYFITFGNGQFTKQRDRVALEAMETKWFDEIIVESPETIKDFINLHDQFFKNNNRGFGYWLWKPYIIFRQLNKMSAGDCLFYTDAGASILPHRENRFNEYVEMLKQSNTPILAFSGNVYYERQFQKMQTLKRFDLHNDDSFLKSPQIESGVIAFKKSEYTMDVVKKWLDVVVENNYIYVNDTISDEHEEFIDNRHDQSILSILCKLNSAHMLVEDAYGEGPFFSSRQTDNGLRDYAPDWWRMELDYLGLKKHPWIYDWLGNKKASWWKSESDYDEDKHITEHDYCEYRRIEWSLGHSRKKFRI